MDHQQQAMGGGNRSSSAYTDYNGSMGSFYIGRGASSQAAGGVGGGGHTLFFNSLQRRSHGAASSAGPSFSSSSARMTAPGAAIPAESRALHMDNVLFLRMLAHSSRAGGSGRASGFADHAGVAAGASTTRVVDKLESVAARTRQQDASADRELGTCRICFETDYVDEMVAPCRCKGEKRQCYDFPHDSETLARTSAAYSVKTLT